MRAESFNASTKACAASKALKLSGGDGAAFQKSKKKNMAKAVAIAAAVAARAAAKIAENCCHQILRWPLRKCHGHCGIVGRRVHACPSRRIQSRRPQKKKQIRHGTARISTYRLGRSRGVVAPLPDPSGVFGQEQQQPRFTCVRDRIALNGLIVCCYPN